MEDVVERSDAGRASDPMIGRVLDGRYEVGPQIARGGMATVYQARDLRLDRIVAAKIMHSGLADDPEFVDRFVREARSAARLSHHNVVAVFDQGDDDGTLYLVMEYVPGQTLRDVIRNEAPMDPGHALDLIEPVLAALAAAHAAGMIHRDVKPENVLIGTDSDSGHARIKVADFGLARAVNAETQHTATGGVLIGTVSYLSPELVVDGKADARSDVYAAGVLIYEMLTGVKPHQADTPIQIAYKHVHEDVPAPSLRIPSLPAYVDALVARATARDRDLRPSDARILLHQVRRVRQALDHGVVDDPELVADLLPQRRSADPDSTPTGVVPLDRAALADDVYDYSAEDRVDFTAQLPTGAPVPPPVASPAPQRPAPAAPAPPRRDDPPQLAQEPGRQHPPQRRSRRGLFLLVGLLLTALVVGVAAWQLGRYTTTPSVISLNEAAAKAKITKAGLKFRLGTPEYSERAAGSVLRTDPKPGDRIAKGDTVVVVLSRGPELHKVPVSRGKTLSEVQGLLDSASLKVGTVVSRFSETVPDGQVIRTSPAAGTLQRPDTAIDIYVSKGRKPIAIPSYVGKVGTAAKKALEKLGFKVTVTEDNSDTVPVGKVIAQTPNSGTGFTDDIIMLSVSKGPMLVEVPRVKGRSTEDATAALTAAGFGVVVARSSLYVGAGIVVSSNPGQGSMAPHGSTVIITIV
ncbi:MAG: Stk1 family PASTA domain-containing Ser/Thr kinase [Marmoricola sp.]